MRLWIGIAVLVLLIIAGVGVLSSIERREGDEQFQRSLKSYRTALKTGSSRAQVEDYLRQQGIPFVRACCEPHVFTDRATLGEEPRNLFCRPWTVYVDFEFSGSDPQANTAQSTDLLKSIDLRKEGLCF